MKVIVITRTMHSKEAITLTNYRGDFGISVTDLVYVEYTSVMGVFKTAEAARQFIEQDKDKLIEQYGAKSLDDEHIKDGHTYYTYGSYTKELEGGGAE